MELKNAPPPGIQPTNSDKPLVSKKFILILFLNTSPIILIAINQFIINFILTNESGGTQEALEDTVVGIGYLLIFIGFMIASVIAIIVVDIVLLVRHFNRKKLSTNITQPPEQIPPHQQF